MSLRRSEPRIASPILVGLFVIVLSVAVLVRAGLPYFVIIGGSAAIAYVAWLATTYRNAFANYLLWFFLVGPGVVNAIAHLSFPFIGHTVYFPGLITVILPTAMSIVVIRALILGTRKPEAAEPTSIGPGVPSD